MDIYYVYAYLRNKDSATAKAGTPYYIGKGKNGRAFAKHGKKSAPKDKTLIQFIAINLSESEAHVLEQNLISLHGRKDLATGILINLTDGGDGTSGILFTQEHKTKLSISHSGKIRGPQSAEHIEKRVSAYRGSKRTDEMRANIKASHQNRPPLTKEQKLKISIAGTGLKRSEEGKKNMCKPKSESHKLNMRKPKPTTICPHCGKVGGVNIMQRYHFSNCKLIILF